MWFFTGPLTVSLVAQQDTNTTSCCFHTFSGMVKIAVYSHELFYILLSHHTVYDVYVSKVSLCCWQLNLIIWCKIFSELTISYCFNSQSLYSDIMILQFFTFQKSYSLLEASISISPSFSLWGWFFISSYRNSDHTGGRIDMGFNSGGAVHHSKFINC